MNAQSEPTPEELHRYAVAWGESQVQYLTDWRYWEKMYNDALEVIRLQAIEIEALLNERDDYMDDDGAADAD